MMKLFNGKDKELQAIKKMNVTISRTQLIMKVLQFAIQNYQTQGAITA